MRAAAVRVGLKVVRVGCAQMRDAILRHRSSVGAIIVPM